MGTPAKHSEQVKTDALTRLQAGQGTREVSRDTGVPASTLSRWAKDAGIVADRAGQTRAATEATALKWSQRRDRLADIIGENLETLLGKSVAAEKGSDASGFAVAFGVFLDKAQLLTGAATSRHEVFDAQRRRERIAEMADELEQRRRLKDPSG